MERSDSGAAQAPRGLRYFASTTWFAPALLAVLFLGVLAGLLWLIQARALSADRATLAASIRTAQASIRQRLLATRDHLVTVAEDLADTTVSADLFSLRLTRYMSEHPELVSVTSVDAGGIARWAVPAEPKETLAERRSPETCREAQRRQVPVYSEVHISPQNEPAFDVCIPIVQAGKPLGAIVGTYSCERILRNMLHREILLQYRASLVNTDGIVIVALPAVERLDERLFAAVRLDPPGQGVLLRLDRYGSGFWGVGMTLLSILCVGLAFGMSIGMWSLKRQIARRAWAERLLREAHDGMAERVRERTADLEIANLQLQREIGQRERAEDQARQRLEELAHVARVSTMGEMAAGLAHELNQPLGAIAGFAEGSLRLIESDRATTPDVLHVPLTEIAEQARRAGQIIHRLRAFVATGQPQRLAHELKPLVEELVALVASELRQEQIDLRLDVPAALPPVLVDGIQAQQVLLNLIRNAMESLQRVPGAARRRIEVTARPAAGGLVMVSVADTGPGCPPETIDRLFDAFFTTKPNGMGMGLSISRSIIEAHEGTLWATPNSSGGLTVHFTVQVVNGGNDAVAPHP